MKLKVRNANKDDLMLYFSWANDPVTRNNSFSSEIISLDQHKIWFENQIECHDKRLFVFENEDNSPIGQVRFENDNSKETSTISISISADFRGHSLSSRLLKISSEAFFKEFPRYIIMAYIKASNYASIKSFTKAGFIEQNSELDTERLTFMLKDNGV